MTIDHDWIQERIGKAQAGDMEAFGDVVERVQGHLRGFVAICGAPDAEVEELAQDAFVEAYGALSAYDRGRSFLPWLRGIARHVVLRRFAQRSTATRLRNERLRLHLCAAAESSEAQEEDPRYDPVHLRACLDRLPPSSRSLLADRYEHGLDADAIADHSRRSGVAIRVALTRIRAALRACIESRLGTSGA